MSLVVTIVLASLATWVAMQTWVQKRLVHAAVLRTIGLTRLQILGIYLSQLLFLVILACTSAMLLAWLLQNMFVGVMQSHMAATLPAANIKPAVTKPTAPVIKNMEPSVIKKYRTSIHVPIFL